MVIKLVRNVVYLALILLRLLTSGLLLSYIRASKSHLHSEKFGKCLVKFLENSGPTFIKLGQVLSTRPDLTGEVVSDQLSLLQDKLPAFDYRKVEAAIQREFDKPIAKVFAEFERTPVAAASIAQVHKARTHEGDEVAVKVLRPNIEKRFELDIGLLSIVIWFANLFVGKRIRNFRIHEVLQTFREIVAHELNLVFEASAADQIRANCANDSEVRIPKVFWHLSGRRILTTQWVHGTALNRKEELALKGFDPKEIVKEIAVTFFNQSFRDGFFHADLHPGNIMLGDDGKIVMIDFGIVGILPKKDRQFIAQILYGFLNHDYELVSKLHFDAGYVPKSQDPVLFALALRAIGEPVIGQPVNKISIAQLLKRLFATAKEFGMETQTQLILLQKTMVTLEGIGYSIYADVNMWQLAEPWIRNWADETFSVRAQLKEFKDTAQSTITRFPDIIAKLDEKLNKPPMKQKVVANKNMIWLLCGTIIGVIFGYLLA